MWILAGLLIFMLGMITFGSFTNSVKSDQQQFEKMLKAGDVGKVSIVNNDYVEFALTPTAQARPENKQLLTHKTPFGVSSGGTLYFPVVNGEVFKKDFDVLQEPTAADKRLPLNIESRESVSNIVSSYGFVLLLIVASGSSCGAWAARAGRAGRFSTSARAGRPCLRAATK